jgi:AraC-like DNA-binding protein
MDRLSAFFDAFPLEVKLAAQPRAASHPVLVALHDSPAHTWTVEELASRAGLPRSHFMALFPKVVGTTAMCYLTQWRVHLGRRELRRGNAKVKAVARRVGFSGAAACGARVSRSLSSPFPQFRAWACGGCRRTDARFLSPPHFAQIA